MRERTRMGESEISEEGKVPRLMIFPDRPDCLVVYLPSKMTLRMPLISSPFTKIDVSAACVQAGLDVRISEGTPGKWGAAYIGPSTERRPRSAGSGSTS